MILKSFKDFYEMIIKGYDFVDFCVFYMWRLFLIKVKWGRFKSVWLVKNKNKIV